MVFRRSLADWLMSCVAAVRSTAAASRDRLQVQYPPLRTEFMEEAAMAREMHRL
jgi:hypothetical protein